MEWINGQTAKDQAGDAGSDALLALILSITKARPERKGDDARLQEDLQLDSLGRVQLQAELEQKLGLTLSDEMLEQASTLGELRRVLGMDAAAQTTAGAQKPATVATEARHDVYPHWPWRWPILALRVAFLEGVMRPLVWLLAAPSTRREIALQFDKPLLLIANHVSIYDVPLVLYALPGRMRRRIAPAMGADVLDDFRKRRNQGSWIKNILGPVSWLLVTALFNVFPLPRSAGFRRSF